jgi:N12 class adenine-specific DNA methylase
MATDPYNPLAPRTWNPAVPDWMNIAYGANKPQAPTFTPEVIDKYHWGKVRARTGYDTAPPERQRAIRNEYVTLALPEVARLTGTDLAQMEAAFRASNPDPSPSHVTASDDGDFVRGVKSYWPGTKASVYGLGALAADLFGADDTAHGWAERAQALNREIGATARPTDSLSSAWGSGEGVLDTTGNLFDWAQYNVGQMLPSVVESLITAAAGAAAGSEVPVLGNITGAIAGLLGKTAIKKELRERTAALVAEHAAKRIAAGTAEDIAKREAAALGQQFLTRTLQREIGSVTALAAGATARGFGDTYNAAYGETQETGGEIDLARVLAGGAIYGAAETFGDKVLADTLLKGVGGTGGLARRMTTAFGKNALTEGTTEAVQQAAQRFGAAQSLTDGEALTEYLDSFAAGAIGGGVYGALGGIPNRPIPEVPPAPLALPAPDGQPGFGTVDPRAPVLVTPEGVASTPSQQNAQRAADLRLARNLEATGQSPDVRAAARDHALRTDVAVGATPSSRATSQIPPVSAAVPEGIDPETGEVLTPPPEPEAVMAAIHAFLNDWKAEPRPTRGDVRRFVETRYPGLPAARMNPLIDRVREQRKAQATKDRAPGMVDPAEQVANMRMLAQIAQARQAAVQLDAIDTEAAALRAIRAGEAGTVSPPDVTTAATAEGAINDETPDAPRSVEALDRAELHSVFLDTMRRKFPNVTDPDSAFYVRSADELIDLIERRNGRGLVARNLGDAKANPASRAVFTAATGIRLPRGRGATEDAIFRWAGTDRATELARDAERRARREAEQRAPVETFPDFASYADARQWQEKRARAFGGLKRYRATQEYGRLFPILKRLADASNDGHRGRRMQALAAAGLAIGDRVQATSMSLLLGTSETARGTLYEKSGFPWVRLDPNTTITVSHKGKIEQRREVPWSERWTKIEPQIEASAARAAGIEEAPVAMERRDAVTPLDASRAMRDAPSPSGNDTILAAFVDDLVAQVRSGQPGRVAFPATFSHVTEVENALGALRSAFERAGAVNSGGRFGARYAVDGGIVTFSSSTNRLWADIQIAASPSRASEPLPSGGASTQTDTTTFPQARAARSDEANPEDTTDAGTGQTETLSPRRARETAGDVADRARGREPLDAGLAQAGAETDPVGILPGGAGEPDRRGGTGEGRYEPESSVELGEGAGVGVVAGATNDRRRRSPSARTGQRERLTQEAAAIDDPAASSVVAETASPQAEPAAGPEAGVVAATATEVDTAEQAVEGLADDLGKGGLARKARDNLAAIRIVKAMAAEQRPASPEERRQLARYVGWGALKGVFDPANAQWAKVRAELQGLLTDAEWRAARASTLNAHYTSKPVIDGMYSALVRLGVTRGRILEPAVGIGHFFGGMPAKLRNASTLYGVELDPLTQQIAAALYPKAHIRQSGFQDVAVPSEFFDVAIGNPPFGSEPIVDSERSPYSGFSIHNYFFAKSIDKLRPGGVLMMVVSRQFLDAKDSRVRQWIAERADLIAAARLPDTAFAENAGTEVVTDIIVLQKRAPDTDPPSDDTRAARLRWVQTVEQTLEHPTTGETFSFRINPWYVDHPDHILGTQTAGGTMYRANDYTVAPSGDLAAQLTAWARTLPEGIYSPIDRTEAMTASAVPEGVKVGAYFIDAEGRIMIRGEDRMGEPQAAPWTAPGATAEARMRGMIEIRDVLRQQMRLERAADASEAQIEANRRLLNDRYDAFLKRYGHLSASRTNRSLFFDDPDASLLLALEFDYDAGVSETVAKREGIEPRAPKATKADIFRRRVLFPPSDFVTVHSARDAYLASLNYRGRLDLDYMTEVYGKDSTALVKELGPLVYETPDGNLVTADDYLSGDVKTKLVEAKDAARRDPRFARNVGALSKVIPRDKTPSEITIALGAPFLPAEDLQAFHREVTGANARMTYVRGSGLWLVNVVGEPDRVLNASTWGTKEMGATEIFQATLAGRAVVVTKTIKHGDGKIERIVLEAETERAREKQNALRAEWRAWVWRDPERAERLLALYNDKMNRTVERRYDGSHLTLPGMSPGLTLLAHQQNGVWRGLQSRQLLLDHVVGAGKTFQMVAIAMEMRRLGVARKPLFAVPNHLTVQWRTEFARLYPGAVVLAAEPDDFTRENRKKLFSRIVTGDWDAIIVGHSSLKKIGLPAETETRILTEQIDEIASLIEQMKRERGDRGIVRDMEGIRARLEAKVKQKLANIGQRDGVLTFDELGVDALFVDELHEFKNLFYTTAMSRVPGMGNPNGSDRAFDLFVKTQWLFGTLGDKAPLVTATGTPVSNSLVEMFNLQRYMQYPTLKRKDLHVFDAWARQYGSIENVYEVAPSGAGFRASTRFAKFQNLPSLMADYRAFADVVTLDDLKAQEAAKGGRFPVPNLLGGRPQIVVAERSPQVAEFMGVPHLARSEGGGVVFGFNPGRGETATIEEAEDGRFRVKIEVPGEAYPRALAVYPTREDAQMGIVEAALTPKIDLNPESILGRFARIRELTRQTKGRVNALSLTGQANKAGLDYRLIDPAAPDFRGSKINLALERMLALYRQWDADKGTQLVFCDLSVPNTARRSAATKPQRVYVREDDGSLAHASGTAHTVAGAEELPFLLVVRGAAARATTTVYDAATGRARRILPGGRDKGLAWAQETLRDPARRERWIAEREAEREAGQELSQAEIDDYNDANGFDAEAGDSLSLQDIVGLSGAEGFNVYDDLRAKLIAGGVPANEIAFIHDYPHPDAKDKLFKRVKSGEVRFLFGSTAKMGAGTNVQDRIVGLHHIDAPWKPSDLEQREGRAIRRGNQLYERDPDGFEVAIYRYATRQTYDTRRWQLLEHKARGIEQLRKYDGQQTEIEDIDGEAANAAEMKAAASGDPLILRETQLRHDVRRLEQLELAHADNQTALQRQARTAEQYAAMGGPRYLKALREVQAQVKQHPLPEDKEAVPGGTTLDGARFGERKALTQTIARRVGALIGPSDAASPVELAYRGVTFEIDRVHAQWVRVSSDLGEVTSYERGAQTFSATGLLTRLNNYIDRIGAEIVDTEARIENARGEAERFRAEAAKPFEQTQALREAREQYRRVQRLLLVRGPEIPEHERPMLDAALEAQRSALREAGFSDALDELLDYQQQRDDDAGAFSKRRNPAAAGASVAQVQRVVDEMLVDWKGAPVVRVVATPDYLPASARRAPDVHLAEGYYARSTGTVYLVASALPNRRAVQRVLIHEAIGHYGIETIVGPAQWAQIAEGVHRLREKGRYRDLFAEHARRGYLDNGWDSTAIAEFIAILAERGVKDSVLDRVVAAVRAFLRKLGVRWTLSEAELRQLVMRAARQVRLGGSERALSLKESMAPAFSRVEGFRSALLQALERAQGAPRRGTAEQWQQWLDGVQRRGGFKQAERDWLDVDVWLTTRESVTGEARITREALTDFVRTHQVRIGEQQIGGDVARYDAALDRLQAAGFEIETLPSYGVALMRDGQEVDERTLTESQRHDLETLSAGIETTAPFVSAEGRYASYQMEGGREYRELLLTFPVQPSSRNPDEPFHSEHYPSVKNVLVHIRYNEREDVDGKRMLFIEEIQSDWHQHGRRYGYRPSADRNVAPDAPFKSTEDWTLLAIKRMVRMAAERGFQRIGWTTGAQQTSRYSRGEQVDAIDYMPMPSGAFRVAGLKQGDVVREMEVPANLLSSLLGAKVAARVRAGEGDLSPRGSSRGTPLRRLDALSLHLGDAGMGGYYDGILPAVVNRWARPLGGQAKTAQIRPRFRSPPLDVHALDITPAMRTAVAEGLPMFSRRAPEGFLADVDAVVRQDEDASRLDRVRQWLRDSTPAKLKDASRSVWLGALATNHLTELGSDYDPAIAGFSRQLDAMSADRNALLEEGADLAESVRRWAGRHKAEAKRLFDLMHRATLEGVDPAEAYQVLQFRYGGQLHDANRKNIREALKALREQMLGRSADNKIDMMEEARRLRGMPGREESRKRIYPTLRAQWQALSPEAQGFYRQMRNLYRDRSQQVEDALAQRIEASEAPDGLKRKLVFSIRQQFETHRLQGVYFPLQRYGEYFIAAERDGEPVFLMLDSPAALERREAAFKARGFAVKARGRLRGAQAKDAPSGSFVADVIEQLRKAGVSEKTQDAIYQTYLQTLPELSMRKHAIHRQGVAGFDPDALRAFAHNMAHGAHQLARLRYGHVLERTLADLREAQDIRRREPDTDTRAVVAMDAILGELDQRHQWVLNPQDSAMTNRLSSIGFVYFLGVTPAAALVNLTQTAVLTFPQLASQFGPANAMRHLMRAMNDSARTAGHAQKVLKRPDEVKAHAALQQAGVLDKTQTHALMGLAEGGLATYNPKLARAMELIGWLFHTAEVLNREASGMAAYRLARDAGQSFDAAVRFAADTITATHFNYSNANRARYLQSGPAKIVLMFKQYGLNMLWHLGRMGWKATRGDSPEVRRLARRNLAGVLVMSGFFSGAMGLPMASLSIGVIDAIAHAFGDEDDPWDTEAEIRKFLAQFLGEAGAEVAMNGAANTLTGADIASRVEMSQLLWRDADRELDGRDAYYAMMDNVAGPMFGIAKNFFVGTQLIAEGQVYRGVETMLPKALKDAMKALRYAEEGVTSTRGDLVTDTDFKDEFLQAIGFTPAEVARQYAVNRALKDRERHILDRRKALLAAYAMALRMDDQDAALEVRRKILAFNKAYPEKPITGQTIRRSLRAREAYSKRAENGVAYDAALRQRIAEEEGVGGE